MSAPRLAGQVAIVTGGGRGIGRAIVQVFAREGAAVLVVDRDETTARRSAEEAVAVGVEASAFRADVTRSDEIEAAVAAAVERFGTIDLLAHNAGIYPTALLQDLTEEGWDHVQAVNVKSLFLLVRAVMPTMIDGGGGRITVTSSITGPRTGYPGLAHYGASKAAINGFIRSAALELAPHAIAINGVEPGTVLTEGVREQLTDSEIEAVARDLPLKRLAAPEDIAHAHLFLASREASYITGQTIVVDGGQILPENAAAVL